MSNVNDTPWDAWQPFATPETWQKAIQLLASHVAAGQATASRAYRSLETHINGIGEDSKAADCLQGELTLTWTDALELGALIGYALARTFPASFDEMDDWPRRALELAGLPTLEASDDDDPPAAA